MTDLKRHYLGTRVMLAAKNLELAALEQDLPEVKYWLDELEQREQELKNEQANRTTDATRSLYCAQQSRVYEKVRG